MAADFTIGEVVRRTGVAATTMRFYEQIRLIPPPRESVVSAR
jgi:DNA-binding transcriptional MerR regulator